MLMCVCLQAFFAEQIDGVMTIINNKKKKLNWHGFTVSYLLLYISVYARVCFCLERLCGDMVEWTNK